jgi:hypothetical protein
VGRVSGFSSKRTISRWVFRERGHLGVGELREVVHHAHFVNVGIDNLLGGEQLGDAQPAVRQVHRFRRVPAPQRKDDI